MGESYFKALAEAADTAVARESLNVLATVERHAARMVVPLLEKYRLEPRSDAELHALGESHAERHAHYRWNEFVAYMQERYPRYMDDFWRLESLAPDEDLPCLQALTAHETAAIEFANREAAGDPRSIDALSAYLTREGPS